MAGCQPDQTLNLLPEGQKPNIKRASCLVFVVVYRIPQFIGTLLNTLFIGGGSTALNRHQNR